MSVKRDGRTVAAERSLGVSRYDILLAVIPAAMICALVVGRLLSLSLRTTLVAGAAVGLLAMVDGLFRHPPDAGGPT
jgi:hypothetical protein